MESYGIAEWFGKRFYTLSPAERQSLAAAALGKAEKPRCPFQAGEPQCNKKGGVCSIVPYQKAEDGTAELTAENAVITCPKRFEEDQLLVVWLAEVAGFDKSQTYTAKEVPFMKNPQTKKTAGKIDYVVARMDGESITWYALEIQAVYFSGPGMEEQFKILEEDYGENPPFPNANRRPDWRSSSAKRLMPQLQAKVPTIRGYLAKTVIAMDWQFFSELGGPTPPDQVKLDYRDGDIIWLVPKLELRNDTYKLAKVHSEVMILEDTQKKLLSAEPVTAEEFLRTLRSKLTPVSVRESENSPEDA